jgi:hypothetical protein
LSQEHWPAQLTPSEKKCNTPESNRADIIPSE